MMLRPFLFCSFISCFFFSSAHAFEEVDKSYLKSLHDAGMSTPQKQDSKALESQIAFGPYQNTEPLLPAGFSLNVGKPQIWASQTNTQFNAQPIANSVLFQANYDFKQTWAGTPFVNAGVGVISQRLDDITLTRQLDNNSISYSSDFVVEANGGLQIPLDDDVSFTGGYRYVDAEDAEFDAADLDYNAHEFRIGLSFKIQPEKR